MSLVDIEDIKLANLRISKYLKKTELVSSVKLDALMEAEIYLKPEQLQRTGSFKFRGAMSAMTLLSEEELKNGVIAFSSGNHAQGVACAAKILKTSAIIVMPSDAPKIKIDKTKSYGAKIIFYDRQNDDRELIGQNIAENENRTLIKPFDDAQIIAGQGTSALEAINLIKDQNIEFDSAVICASGGGLTAGSAIALKHFNKKCQIYTAEPMEWNDHELSFKKNKRLTLKKRQHGLCDALESPSPGKITFKINNNLGVKGISVNDEAVINAMKFAYEEFNFILEPSGAVGLAAAMKSKSLFKGKKNLIILSGGNISKNRFNQYIA